ncbi:hypothetical protein KC318_g12490 [Hortaea werneckii]|uniref:Uncharacterized protein n=2 Tax=Hortaea werneckii TaxID=91943 RepID=A0A3M6ZX43_HORWE|nr:hypothetical protein KC334_g12864 [Hortaea werneckii]KAI7656303.1 hypothetical protein KC318_g12490 [Hortaea werneckii]RMY19620.1 hypothetical protein D0867_04585 [Hortaea werneckii]
MTSNPRREQKRKRTTSSSTENNQRRDLPDGRTTQPTDRIGAAASKQPTASPMDRTWIFYNSTEDHNRGQKQTVRSHAAIASWAARRQQWQNSTVSFQNTDGRRTPAEKQPAVTSTSSANRQESPLSTTWSTNSSQPSRELQTPAPRRPLPEEAWNLLEKMGADCAECLRSLQSEDHPSSSPACLVDLVKNLHEHRRWFSGGIDGSSLAQRATRAFLWDSFASTGLLSHIVLLVAGTYTQCPQTALAEDAAWELSSIQRATRGATLRMLQAAVAAPQCDATTPLALATFSSWERRYGDGVGWKDGMEIWDKASLPSKALDADLSPLVEVAQEIMRQELEDRSYISPRQIHFRPPEATEVQGPPTKPAPGTRCIPAGFSVFRMDRPEHRSLVSLADDVYQNLDPTAESSAYRRRLGFAITSWSPRHTLASETCTPDLLHLMEREHSDQAELSALLHVRACLRVLNTLLNSLTLDHLGELSRNVYAVQRGLDLCTASYVARLDTEALAGTRFAHVGFWAVYVLCSISFSEGQAELLRRLMRRYGLGSWEQVDRILASHMDRDVPSIWEKCRALFDERLDPSSSSSFSSSPGGPNHPDREELDARMAVRDLWK